MNRKKKSNIAVEISRWTGRVISILMILLMLAFLFDEGLPKFLKFAPPEIILFLAFFIILAGYITAWKNESAGAILIVAGTVFFWAVNTVATGRIWMGPFLFVFPLTAFPFVYCWWKEK